jgi:WD40 repeat protein
MLQLIFKKAIKIFDAQSLRVKDSLAGHTSSITGVCWQPGSDNVLFSSSLDKTVKMWDLREKNKNTKTFTFGTFASLDFSNDR